MFIEIPASKKSISSRKLLFGIGINNADYMVNPRVNGKKLICPIYQKWSAMISRCYSKKIHNSQPTYSGCSVCDKWVYFSNFRQWMINQDWQGKALDKDIISPGNKVYSPDNCCFISGALNSLLNGYDRGRGNYPKGVSWHIGSESFEAYVSYKGKRIRLGYYSSPKEASKIYIKAKIDIILEAAGEQTDDRISNGLRIHADLLNALII